MFNAQHANDGSAYSNDWISLEDQVTNNLIGLQFGGNVEYQFGWGLKGFVTPKVALCENHMTLDYNLHATGARGAYYQAASQTYATPNYPLAASADGFSFLTQVDAGVDWKILPRWGAQIGYRVVAVTGVALADNQLGFNAADTLGCTRTPPRVRCN